MLLLVVCLIVFNKYHHNLSRYLKLYSNFTVSRNYTRQSSENQTIFKPYLDDCDRSLSNSNNQSRFVENCSGLLPLNEEEARYNRQASLHCDSCTSGSGSGMPFLVQRTIARQVQLISGIGKGRFGEVWKGAYYGEMVAVKIFSSRDETSWARETHIYNTYLLRHPNILGYYASDMVSRFGCTQLWLITHYHALGSLYDYLHSTVISFTECVNLLHSTAAGLSHLHTEIISGPQGKPSIAHRDLKSKNILIVKPGEACIADLGLSVLQSSTNCLCPSPVHSKHKIGTRRYMAPEILADCLCPDSDYAIDNCLADPTSPSSAGGTRRHEACPIRFEHFVSADIYAFALVMWEVVSRTCLTGSVAVGEYRVPYQDIVPLDPSTVEMRQLVCVDKFRPVLPQSESVLVAQLSAMIRESWAEKAQTRPSALRLKKNLKSLLSVDTGRC